jgi:hypothetical protein
MIRRLLEDPKVQWPAILGLPLFYDYSEAKGYLEISLTYLGGVLITAGCLGLVGFFLLYILSRFDSEN